MLNQGEITHEGTFDYILQSCPNVSSFFVQETDEDKEQVKEGNEIDALQVAASKLKLQAASKYFKP